ncbi:MAG: matrixin family metalloprotease [Myxococcota bacterium]
MFPAMLMLSAASAFEVQTVASGAEMHWGEMPVSYAWAGGDSPAIPRIVEAIDASYDAWAAIDDAYVFVDARNTALAPTVELDDENLVFFTTDWPDGNEALAITTTWTDEEGAVVQYDIHINATVAWSTTGAAEAYDLQAAITHEVGHVLGLGHSAVEDSTMFAKHELADVHRRELHDDDRAAARYLYDEPPPEAENTGDPPDTGGAALCATGPVDPRTIAILVGLPLFAFARRGVR